MKHVAKTITSLPNDETWNRFSDPDDDLDDVIQSFKQHWSYDLYSRKPGPALLDRGTLHPTDLDLACFLSALVDRSAVITIPTYKSRRPRTEREGEMVVSKENRHGHVLGLVANKDVFSFSIRINDMNVVSSDGTGKDVVGAPRSFMLVDLEGVWYDGWKKIVFMPSRKENDFLEDKSLWTGNEVVFENFVHPNRWVSFYGKWYLMTKTLIERLRVEASYRFQEIKALKESGLSVPSGSEWEDSEWPKTEEVGEKKSITVKAFEAAVEGAEIPERYELYPQTSEGLASAKARLNKIRYHDIPELTFAVRSTELAFAKRAGSFIDEREKDENGDRIKPLVEPFPAWISGAKWDPAYKIKRTLWNRLVLHQEIPFANGIALRYRVYEKTETVAG